MERLSVDELESADVVADNIERLRGLFPEAFSEDGIDFYVLRQLLGAELAEGDEKYGLNWHGKRRARQIALTPSTGTLRPCLEDSVDWDTTQNLMIEGDNLEVLKLLQKSYAGKVKLIYIDPPYNTGKDFIYKDNFRDNISNYLEVTGQTKGGAKLTSNTESSGRFHTDWLNMMYPRLKLARNLLADNGVIFISIDDNELDHLKELVTDLFGGENFVGIVAIQVNPRGRHLDKFIAKTHDYAVICVKDADHRSAIRGIEKSGDMLDEYDKEDDRGRHRELGLRNRNQAFNPQTRPNLFFPLYVNPDTGSVALDPTSGADVEVLPIAPDGTETCWTWGRGKVGAEQHLLTARQVADGSWRVYRKDYLTDENGDAALTLAKSIWLEPEFNNDYGRKAVKELLGSPVMDFPKSPYLIQRYIEMGSNEDSIILDFFAGSATTGQAVLERNALDGGRRRYIMVQLPEEIDPEDKNQRAAMDFCDSIGKPRNIAEIAKERMRRVGVKIHGDNPLFAGDVGFRVFKLDTSNIRGWSPDPEELEDTLLAGVDHIREDRAEADILYELLLKLGLDLCVPIETRAIADRAVHSIGAGTLLVCLDERIDQQAVEPLALGIVGWHAELNPAGDTTVVFRDSSFADDVAKTNLTAVLHQHQLTNVRSL